MILRIRLILTTKLHRRRRPRCRIDSDYPPKIWLPYDYLIALPVKCALAVLFPTFFCLMECVMLLLSQKYHLLYFT